MTEKRYPLTMMCAACIPWTADLRLDEAAFRRELGHMMAGGAKSIYILGTAGEGYAMDTDTFTQVVRVFLDQCAQGEGMLPMVGVISTSMAEDLARIRIAYDLGARDFQISLPCWGALTDREAETFFRTVCGAFPDCRFIHYNNGSRAKRLLTIQQYRRLAPLVPNLAAVKYSTPNLYEIHALAAAEDCPIAFYLVDAGYTFGAQVGRFGFLNSFASLDMDLAWRYFRAGQARDYETLVHLGNCYLELTDALQVTDRTLIDAALDKTIERAADPAFPNALYPPYEGLTEAEFARANAQMQAVLANYRK